MTLTRERRGRDAQAMRTTVLRSVPARSIEPGRQLVRIRAIRPTDAGELERFYAALSPESRRTRFFSFGSGLSHTQAVSFCTTDHDHRKGFVAVAGSRLGPERIVGHLCLEPGGTDTAEVAIAVADDFQHRGIGRRLLVAGLAWARRGRIGRFTATMLAGNTAIHRLLVGLRLPYRLRWVGAGVAEIEIDLEAQSIAA